MTFKGLSYEAQTLIVNALMGLYDNCDPPEISESIQNELIAWCEGDDQ